MNQRLAPPPPTGYRRRLRALADRWQDGLTSARRALAHRLHPEVATVHEIPGHPAHIEIVVDTLGGPPLDPEAAAWVHAHRTAQHATPATPGAAAVLADRDVQEWMAATLTTLGWDVTSPLMLLEGWVPARGENTPTGQPFTTYTTPSKTFARHSDPATSKAAGAVAAAHQSITVSSHQGRLLQQYHARHQSHPGLGYTAAEAVDAANLRTDGATGSPWHRVTDLRDMGLLTYLLDGTGKRTTRKNESNADGQVLVITPLGLRAAAALNRLDEVGYRNQPLLFDGPAEPALFEDLGVTLARVAPDSRDSGDAAA